ncbi:MAG TPA: carbohydrate ABC transporter permease, partial [Clostridiaceae bacterium]|nr:carbohydrate ABC transporter permease [Clostridiaceae bacterium]
FGVIIVYMAVNMSFTVFLYTGFIRSLSIELEEAAIVDGCSRMGIFWRIIFPLVTPITATVAILNSLNIWNDFLIPLLLISSPSKRNIPNALFAFQGQYNNKWDMAFAALILSIIPIVIFYVLLQKRIIKGIAQGSIKG